MKLGNFNGGYKILDFVKAVAYATGSASTETISGLYNRVKEALEDKSKPLVLHDLIIDVSGSQTLIGDTFIDRANAKVDASKVVFFIGVGSNNVKITVTSVGALNADVYEYAGGAGGVSDLSDLDDIALNDLTNGQILKYNSTTGKWENANESGGGGADYQIIDSASETIWDDCEALDLTKPVFIKRGNYCVSALKAFHGMATSYFFMFIDGSDLYNLSVVSGEPATVTVTKRESLTDMFHYNYFGIVSAYASITDSSDEVDLTNTLGQVTTIDGLVGGSTSDVLDFNVGKVNTTVIFALDVAITDADTLLVNHPARFLIPITRRGSLALEINEAVAIAYDSTAMYKYRIVPNKTNYTVGEATPEALSFTVYREVLEDVYIIGQEVLTNKRFNGEPVYRKVYSITGNDLKVDWSGMTLEATSDINKLLSVEGMALRSDGYTILPFYKNTTDALTVTALLRHADGGVLAYCNYFTSGTATIDMLNIGIEYTKATT